MIIRIKTISIRLNHGFSAYMPLKKVPPKNETRTLKNQPELNLQDIPSDFISGGRQGNGEYAEAVAGSAGVAQH